MTDVILIHGLSGGPADMQYITDKLLDKGYNVLNIRLPGHGTKPEDLLNVNMQNWIDTVESQLNACHGKAFIIGQSMGALLALYCAAMCPEKIKGISLLSPAISLYGRLNRFFVCLIYTFSLFLPIPHLYYKKTKGPDIADQHVKKNYSGYNSIPLKALVEFERLRRLVISKLRMIKTPVLIIYSHKDHTIATNAVEIIDKGIGSNIKEKKELYSSFHVISIDVEKEVVSDNILKFQKIIETGVK